MTTIIQNKNKVISMYWKILMYIWIKYDQYRKGSDYKLVRECRI